MLTILQEHSDENIAEPYEPITSEPDCTLPGSWGPWAPCSVTCGEGFKIRYKKPFDEERCDAELVRNQTTSCRRTECPMPGKLKPSHINISLIIHFS